MSNRVASCFLRCVKSSHPDIALPHGEQVIVGRGKVTRIKESRCSREQIRFVSDCKGFTVSVTQVGVNSSSIRGEVVGFGETVLAKHKDIVEILSGQFSHQVIFNPSPSEKDSDVMKKELVKQSSSEKRKVEHLLVETKKVCSNGVATGATPWFDSSQGKLIVRLETAGTEGREKIAAFDIDGTLITTMSGKVFPTDINDWKILFSQVPGKLKALSSQGFKLVFITNQAGIAKGKLTVEQFQLKMSNLLARLGVSATVFCSTSDTGYYRKPRPGIWEWLEIRGNHGVVVDRNESFYCGDAAGRQVGWLTGKKKDFSCSDRLLATNLGIKFFTPEELFLDHKPTNKFDYPFHPKSLKVSPLLDPEDSKLVPSRQFLALLVGIQGSGKSQVAYNLEQEGVVVASNDRTGGKEKTLRVAEKALAEGKSVVVDNTHVDRDARKQYIALGVKFGVLVRGLVMNTTHDHARHNSLYRELTDPSHARIKTPLFNQYRARYSPPTMDEGFSEIVQVNCVPSFASKEFEQLYNMYLLEK